MGYCSHLPEHWQFCCASCSADTGSSRGQRSANSFIPKSPHTPSVTVHRTTSPTTTLTTAAAATTSPPLSTWVKYDGLYCDSYGYRGNAHNGAPSLTEALHLCQVDENCAAIAEWNCGDGWYNYCGVTGYGKRNYGAGRCVWEKPPPLPLPLSTWVK